MNGGNQQAQSGYQKLVDTTEANKLLNVVPTDGISAKEILEHKAKMHTTMDEPVQKSIVV